MITVELVGWHGDLWPISMVKFIRKYSGLGLAEGKQCMEEFLHGNAISLILHEESVDVFLEEAKALSLVCKVYSQ